MKRSWNVEVIDDSVSDSIPSSDVYKQKIIRPKYFVSLYFYRTVYNSKYHTVLQVHYKYVWVNEGAEEHNLLHSFGLEITVVSVGFAVFQILQIGRDYRYDDDAQSFLR